MKWLLLSLAAATGCNDILGLRGGWVLANGDGGLVDAAVPFDGQRLDAPFDAATFDFPRLGEIDAAADAAGRKPDARPPADATPGPDAALLPPVTNGESADVVLGQPNFTSSTANNGSQGSSTLSSPGQGTLADDRLFIGDPGNKRILEWSPTPAGLMAAASQIVGQSSYQSSLAGPTQSLLSTGTAAIFDGSHLLVSDGGSNRILIWSPLPTTAGQSANIVLGQTSFTGSTMGMAATNLDSPQAVWSDGTHVVVADASNHRILIWKSFPTTSSVAADVVLGWSTFGHGYLDGPTAPPTGATLNTPSGVFSDGKTLWVADSGNNRVLGWKGIPTTSGQAADIVLGQSTFATGTSNPGGVSALTMSHPNALWVQGRSLFVSDRNNHRILVFTPVPTASGTPASAVVGQVDMTHNSHLTTSDNTLAFPGGVTASPNELYVSDTNNNRVLGFPLAP